MAACSSETPSGTENRPLSANGTRTYSAWAPSMRWPKIQPMPPVPWQCEGMPSRQYSHSPQRVMHETITRSPALTRVHSGPTRVTVPTPSWPRMRPGVTAGTSPLRMCRSVPQMVVVSILTIASVGSWISGPVTSSQDYCPGP